MILYGGLASPYVARVVLFARLKGLALEPRMPEGGIKSPEYLALNPMGKMPVLDADGTIVPESEVICEFLEDLYPGTGGLPGGPADRALARLVSRVHDVYVYPHANVLFRSMNPATRDAAKVAAAQSSLETGLGDLAHFVAAAPFAAGRELSLADCTLLPSFAILRKTAFRAYGLADPTEGDGSLGRWWRAMQTDTLTSAFLAEYSAALDAFLKALAAKK